MEIFHITGDFDTPTILFDKEKQCFEISGNSMPEDVIGFYKPVMRWLTKYKENPNKITKFNFKWNYFNTASSKIILDILLLLEEIKNNNNEVIIRWHYLNDDIDMKEAGMDYADMVSLPFEYVEYTES